MRVRKKKRLERVNERLSSYIFSAMLICLFPVGIYKNNYKNKFQKLESEYLAEYSMYRALSGIKWIGKISRIIWLRTEEKKKNRNRNPNFFEPEWESGYE